jgi:hypothetical protein
VTGAFQAWVRPGVAPEWPALAVDAPLLASPGWLRAMDGRLGRGAHTIVVTENGRPCVAAFASIQDTPRPTEFFDLHHVLVDAGSGLPLTDDARAARAALATTAPEPRRWTPNVVVMLPGYECVPVGPATRNPAAVGTLVDGALDLATDRGARTVAFLYTRPDEVVLAAALAGRGFVPVPLSLTWDLPVPPDGLAGYLRSLPGRRRRTVGAELRRVAASGVEVRRLGPARARTDAVVGELTALRCQLVRKYRGGADEDVERRRLDRLVHDVAAGRPVVFQAVAAGSPVGFALFAPHGRDLHCLAVGFDYRDPRSRLAYFATAFYGPVPAAAAAGFAWLRYGQGSGAAKRSRGCVATPLTGWVRSEDPDIMAAATASARVTTLLPSG